jgi:rfaE bifunctional protein kinase chain/domain
MSKELWQNISALQGGKILVLGDMIADIYLDGRISRISREAPVLVLEQAGEKVVAGGAANVANNAATLGGDVFAAGVLGSDNGADGLKRILRGNGAHIEGLLSAAERPTISKTRIVAGGRATVSQQIVRIDKASREPLPNGLEKELAFYLHGILPRVQGVVLSDYGNGTITPDIRRKLLSSCRRLGIVSMVDSRYDVHSFRGVDYIKQNDAELAAAVGRELLTEDDLRDAAHAIIASLDAKGALITRGEEGMILFLAGGVEYNIPVSDKSEVYDVSGAGDTCVAAFMLALAGGVAPEAATELANYAAGIAVRKLGTATVSAMELRKAIEH